MLAFVITAPARGQLEVCNRVTGADSIRVALGYRVGGEWASKGWFTARQGQCVTLLQDQLSHRYYYIYARSYPHRELWEGDHFFCTSARGFMILGTHACTDRGHGNTGFYTLDTGESRFYREELVRTADQRAAVAMVRHTERESMIMAGTSVLVMQNLENRPVSFNLICFNQAGTTMSFPIQIAPGGTVEIGYLQGWLGNFVPGQRCEAYVRGSGSVWRHSF